MTHLKQNLVLVGLLIFGLSVLPEASLQANDDPLVVPIHELYVETASAVAWSPDGAMLAVGDDTGVLLFDQHFNLIETLHQPSEQMEAVQWSPNGDYIAAASINKNERDGEVRVWHVRTAELITVFDQQRFLIPTLSWSPDSTRIASGAWDRTIKVWNALSGDVLHTFPTELVPSPDHLKEVFSLSWAPDREQVAAVVGFFGVFVWDTETGELILSVTEEDLIEPLPHVVAWSPDGKFLADDTKILDAQTGEILLVFEACPPINSTIDWHPNSQFLALYREDRVVICDVHADLVVAELEGTSVDTGEERIAWTYLYGLDWHPNGQLLAGTAGDGIVRIWQVSI